MKVGIFPNKIRDIDYVQTKRLIKAFNDSGIDCLMCKSHAEDFPELASFPNGKVDVVITLGGDGTVILAKKYCIEYDVPLLGINMGNIGFLTQASRDDFDEVVDKIKTGNYGILYKTLVEVDGYEHDPALNDVYLMKTIIGQATWFRLYIGKDYIGRYKADGFLVSTPTGSTAYALSAGGPIISPYAKCMTLIGLNAHSLTMRPIIVNDDEVIRIEAEENTSIVIDGETKSEIKAMTVRKSPKVMRFINIHKLTYYENLNRKLV